MWDDHADEDAPGGRTPVTPPPRRQHNPNIVPNIMPNTIPNADPNADPNSQPNQYVEIKIPSFILAFANVQINISPSHVSVATGESSMPRLGSQQDTPPRNVQTRSPTPRTAPVDHNVFLSSPPSVQPLQHNHRNAQAPVASTSRLHTAAHNVQAPVASTSRRHTAVVQTMPQVAQPVAQNGEQVPQPIYPIPLGEQAPLERTFDPGRTHAYYVVFIGPRLGIFCEYW